MSLYYLLSNQIACDKIRVSCVHVLCEFPAKHVNLRLVLYMLLHATYSSEIVLVFGKVTIFDSYVLRLVRHG